LTDLCIRESIGPAEADRLMVRHNLFEGGTMRRIALPGFKPFEEHTSEEIGARLAASRAFYDSRPQPMAQVVEHELIPAWAEQVHQEFGCKCFEAYLREQFSVVLPFLRAVEGGSLAEIKLAFPGRSFVDILAHEYHERLSRRLAEQRACHQDQGFLMCYCDEHEHA